MSMAVRKSFQGPRLPGKGDGGGELHQIPGRSADEALIHWMGASFSFPPNKLNDKFANAKIRQFL